MMISKILLIFLPAVLAEITIDISWQKIQGFGDSADVVSDSDREIFHITEENLKNAVENFTQSRPDDVFVKSPASEDLYKRHNWTEVRRTLKVKSASWLARRVEPQEIARKEFYNDNPASVKYTGQVSQTVNCTISKRNKFIFDTASVNYKINASDVNFKKDSGVNINTASMIGSCAYNITLQPGQKASATLMADQCFMLVEVVYEASLSGSVAANYGYPRKGLQIWAFDINEVLDAAGLPRTVEWQEVFNVAYYNNETLVVLDGSGHPL